MYFKRNHTIFIISGICAGPSDQEQNQLTNKVSNFKSLNEINIVYFIK